MSPDTRAVHADVAVLSAERRIRTALRALLEADHGYTVSVAATPEEARTLLATVRPAAVVIGLGPASGSTDATLLRLASEGHPGTPILVGSGDGLDLHAGPDVILAAVERAIGSSTAVDRRDGNR